LIGCSFKWQARECLKARFQVFKRRVTGTASLELIRSNNMMGGVGLSQVSQTQKVNTPLHDIANHRTNVLIADRLFESHSTGPMSPSHPVGVNPYPDSKQLYVKKVTFLVWLINKKHFENGKFGFID